MPLEVAADWAGEIFFAFYILKIIYEYIKSAEKAAKKSRASSDFALEHKPTKNSKTKKFW